MRDVTPPHDFSHPVSNGFQGLLSAPGGHVGLARPHSMAPPRHAPRGEWVPPPPRPARPKEEAEVLAREMLAPQKLALMSQLMRRIASAASRGAPASGSVRDGASDKDAGGGATDLHGIAQLALRARRSSTSSDW